MAMLADLCNIRMEKKRSGLSNLALGFLILFFPQWYGTQIHQWPMTPTQIVLYLLSQIINGLVFLKNLKSFFTRDLISLKSPLYMNGFR